jgi:hypothetical protein
MTALTVTAQATQPERNPEERFNDLMGVLQTFLPEDYLWEHHDSRIQIVLNILPQPIAEEVLPHITTPPKPVVEHKMGVSGVLPHWVTPEDLKHPHLPPQTQNELQLLRLGYYSGITLDGKNIPEEGKLTRIRPIMFEIAAKNNTLSLPHHRLAQLPVQIGTLIHLTNIDLSNNLLTHLPEELGQCVKLTSLHLNGNRLTGLPGSLRNLRQLAWLHLANNDIQEVPPVIFEIPSLQYIDLSYNSLQAVPQGLAQLPQLTTVMVKSDVQLPGDVNNNFRVVKHPDPQVRNLKR